MQNVDTIKTNNETVESSTPTRSACTAGCVAEVKLTKTALNKFIKWSKSRYNDYCGYGTKKENVELIYVALKTGSHKGENIFKIHCADSVGESGTGRYWRTKEGGGDYTINCISMTIVAERSGRTIKFKRVLPMST